MGEYERTRRGLIPSLRSCFNSGTSSPGPAGEIERFAQRNETHVETVSQGGISSSAKLPLRSTLNQNRLLDQNENRVTNNDLFVTLPGERE